MHPQAFGLKVPPVGKLFYLVNAIMGKVDFKKSLKEFYSASKAKPCLVDLPAMNFIMVDGVGGVSSR